MSDAGNALGGAAKGATAGATIGSAVPVIGTAIGAALGGVIGGIGGLFAGRKDRKKAEEAHARAMELIEQTGAPPDMAKQIMMDQFKSAGVYSPELEGAINQEVSKVSQIKEDSTLKDAQMAALGSLQQRGRTGLSAQDRAALNQTRGEVQRDAEAKRQQIIQNMQARGQAGGGSELAAQLMSAQGSADQASAQGDRIAAQASENALNAIGQAGNLGGQIRQQDFSVANTKASAEDEMNRFNIQNAVNRQMRNVGSRNSAQQANLQNNQQIMNANTQMNNAERVRQAEGARQTWQDNLSYNTKRAGMNDAAGDRSTAISADKAQRGVSIGGGIGAGFGALQNYLNAPKTPSEPQEPLVLGDDLKLQTDVQKQNGRSNA